MPTPAKPASVIRLEGKSHRTKKEIAARERAESQLLTGKMLKESPEVKNNDKAHQEFVRLKKLLKSIDKDDDLYGATINRYCLLQAECADLQLQMDNAKESLELLGESKSEFASDMKKYFLLFDSMTKNVINLDKQIQSKRKMLFDIEKENIMTIASSLRSVPKKVETKKSALMEALMGGN